MFWRKVPGPLLLIALCAALLCAGCGSDVFGLRPTAPAESAAVTLTADGETRELTVEPPLSVADVLRQAGVTLGELDRVTPSADTRITSSTAITVVRITEETIVAEETVAFARSVIPSEDLDPSETRLVQPGSNGRAEVTYRIVYEDGVEASRSEVRRTVITPPQDEVVMVGRSSDLPTVTVEGTLAYLSAGNAWVIRQNSANRRPLTQNGGLDGRVFELSADGSQLLFTRATADASSGGSAEPGPFNALWAVLDTTDPEAQPIDLGLQNVLFAAWVPGSQTTIVYSTAEPRLSFPGWQANNDLWRTTVGAEGIAEPELLLEPSGGGIYGWYGTTFGYSPNGEALAWARPDAVGVLALSASSVAPYTAQPLIEFAPWNVYDFVWMPAPAWSPDGSVVTAATHGDPLGSEAAEDSPVFSLTALAADGSYRVTLVERAGMWSEPRYAANGALAYLQPDDPLESVNGRYRLVVMDRDGSNARALYPPAEAAGLYSQTVAWSPDGSQIALVDPGPEGNLIIVDAASGLAQQVTADGLSSAPRWAP